MKFGRSCFRALLMLSQMLLLWCAAFTNVLRIGGRSSRYCFSFPLLLPQFMMLLFIYIFDCALFLQCSHVTSMQSPYVLNSNVEDYRRISHKPLNYTKTLQK